MTSVPVSVDGTAGAEPEHLPVARATAHSSSRLPGAGSRILIAADKVKGSLTAAQVGAAVRTGINRVLPQLSVDSVPVADGGDGTLAAAVAAGYERAPVTASGPTGLPVESGYARMGDRAVVELADVSGLSRLPGGQLAPLTASSRGTGELIAAALDAGCRHIVVGIGGSASTDGGAGLIRALGGRLFRADGSDIADGGGGLEQIDRVDLSNLNPALAEADIVIACDVDNPLVGDHGAAATYGPQKGATPNDVARLDGALARWADAVQAATGKDHRNAAGAGAAGGVGFAAIALLGASLRPGIDLLLELVGFHRHLAGAVLVITGEGSLDEQTLHGKAPAGVASAAAAAGVPVVAVCGRNLLTADALRAAGVTAAYSLLDIEPDPQRCMAEAAPLLERLGRTIAEEHLMERTA
jgi:glycerate kinase